MSTFACPLVKIKLEPHPNADAIEIAKVGDYQTIVKKGQFKDGDFGIYLPEGSLLPDKILEQLGFWKDGAGTLSGRFKNRVKAIKLRGVLSEGVLFPVADQLMVKTAEGFDYAELLGVTKYEPPVPSSLHGEVSPYHDLAFKFDVENFKKYPDVFTEDDYQVVTNKDIIIDRRRGPAQNASG